MIRMFASDRHHDVGFTIKLPLVRLSKTVLDSGFFELNSSLQSPGF